jgi:hypothetical protein
MTFRNWAKIVQGLLRSFVVLSLKQLILSPIIALLKLVIATKLAA